MTSYKIPRLLAMTQVQLDELSKEIPLGDITNGDVLGTAINVPGLEYGSISL